MDVSVFEILNQTADLVAPLLGNRRCYGNHLAPHSLGVRPHVSFQEWSLCDHPQWSYGTFYLNTLYACTT